MMNSRMLTIVAVAILLVSISSGSSARTEVICGGGVSRTAAACSGVRPAARRPLSRARLGRSTLSKVASLESPSRSTGLRGRQLGAVGGDGHVGLLVVDGGAGGGVVGHRTHADVDAGRRAELLDPGDPARGVGPGDHDVLGRRCRCRRGWRCTMIAARATALMISVTLKRGGAGGLADLPLGDQPRSGAHDRTSATSGRRLDGVLIGGPADEGEEHLGQAAAVERELVDRSGPPGGVEHRRRPARRRCRGRRAASSARGRSGSLMTSTGASPRSRVHWPSGSDGTSISSTGSAPAVRSSMVPGGRPGRGRR